MADVVKAEGLVIAYNKGGNIYPLACAKDATISITREFLELAPKTNNSYKRFIPTKRSFTISGSGLVKLDATNQHGLDFFDDMFNSINTNYVAYLDVIDNQNNYVVYQFNCYISELTLDSTVNNFANYSYTLQGNGAFAQINTTDLALVISGYIGARSTASWKLVAIGYGGKWYYNYVVTIVGGVPVVDMGTALNGDLIRAVYIPV